MGSLYGWIYPAVSILLAPVVDRVGVQPPSPGVGRCSWRRRSAGRLGGRELVRRRCGGAVLGGRGGFVAVLGGGWLAASSPRSEDAAGWVCDGDGEGFLWWFGREKYRAQVVAVWRDGFL